jgi:hypothetical protein
LNPPHQATLERRAASLSISRASREDARWIIKTLPDNPNIVFLKREAKDVLAALRESSADATLSDAQRAVAEQYGFRSWTDLKAEVERRRAIAAPGDAGLGQALADAFGLGDVCGPMLPLAHEPMGRKWSLQTERGRCVVWPLYEWVNQAQAETGATLLEAARAAGITAPMPVRCPAGHLVVRVAGRNWRAEVALQAGPSPAKPVRAAVARKLGETLALLHGLAIPASGDVHPFLTFRRPREHWVELLERAQAAGVDWAPQFASHLPSVLELADMETRSPPSAPILCHSNLIPENVRLARGDDLVVLHWDFAGALVAEWELANTLVHWAFHDEPNGRVNDNAVRALLDGYRCRSGVFPVLTLADFCVAVSGWLNWSYNQFCAAIDHQDREAQAFAMRETRWLLAYPLTVDKVERMADAVAAGART